jgi:hypothetical protein
MKQHRQSIARLLLAVLLLVQLGSAVAGLVTQDAEASCSNHAAVLGHVAFGVAAGMTDDARDCDDGSCVVHCVAPMMSSGVTPLAVAAYVPPPPFLGRVPLTPPEPLKRPPRLLS